MPFYLSKPRLNRGGGQLRQASGRTDYDRSAPTEMMVFGHFPSKPFADHMADVHSGLVMASYEFAKKGSINGYYAIRISDPRHYSILVEYGDAVKIKLPPFTIGFDEAIGEHQAEFLEQIGANELDIKGKGHLFVADITADQFSTIADWENLNDKISPIADTIKVTDATPLVTIIRIISTAALVLELLNRGNTIKYDVDLERCTPFDATGHRDSSDLANEIMGEKIRTISKVKGEHLICYQHSPIALPWGNQFPATTSSRGLFLPYEANYTSPDPHAFQVLYDSFGSIFSGGTKDGAIASAELNESWIKGIHRSMTGQMLAHMIAALKIARMAHGRIFFKVRNGIYEGSVIHGGSEFTLSTKFSDYTSMTATTLMEDIQSFNSHSTSLQKILDLVNIPGATVDNITSMRSLRDEVYGYLNNGMTTDLRSKIQAQLMYLNFNEVPKKCNPQTIKEFLEYATPGSNKPPPSSLFMDRSVFFETNENIRILSMFGSKAPSPTSAGSSYPILKIELGINKGTNGSPPVVKLQYKKVSTAASDWKGFFAGGGVLVFDATQKTKNARKFTGAAASQMWGILAAGASAGFLAKKSRGLATEGLQAGGNKRKGDEDPDSNRFQGERGNKKLKISNPFA